MYSFEIDNLIRSRGGVISLKEYREIFRSPQIDHVQRQGTQYMIWSKDGYGWRVSVRKD